MTTPFIYEFMYRGRPESGPGAGEPAWHVLIGQHVAIPGAEPQLVVGQAMTPEQAAAAGFPLLAIFADLDAAALASRDAAQAEAARLTGELEAAVKAKAEAEAIAADARAEMAEALVERDAALANLAALQAEVDEHNATHVQPAAAAHDAAATALHEANLEAHAQARAEAEAEAEAGPAA